MTKHAFGANVPGTPVGKCSHVRLYCPVLLYIVVPEFGKECRDCWVQGTRKTVKTSSYFNLTIWNSANFVGDSSKSHILSKLLW